MKLNPENAIYLYVNNKLLRPDKFIGDIYDECKSEDLYLHIKITDIPTLGGFN